MFSRGHRSLREYRSVALVWKENVEKFHRNIDVPYWNYLLGDLIVGNINTGRDGPFNMQIILVKL